MRVLHVDGGRGWGGGQRQVWLLGQWQLSHAADVTLASPRESPLCRRAAAADWEIFPLDRIYPWNLAGALRLARMAHLSNIEIVHTHSSGARAMVGLLRRLRLLPPHVTTRRTAFAPPGLAARGRSRWMAGAGVDGMIAISQAAASSMRAAGGRPHRLAVIPSMAPQTLPPSAGNHAPPGALAGVPSEWVGRRLVGTVGSLVPEKGISTLLQGWPRILSAHGEARLVIVGDGPDRGALLELAESLGVASSVAFTGWLDEPWPLLSRLDVLVQPSTSEALGNAVLEAMTLGVPVVASAVGGLPELLASGGSGLLVSPADPVALAAAVGRLLEDRHLAESLAAAARRRLRACYAQERLGAAVAGFYSGVLGRTST